MKKKSYTLIEIMMVVVIAALLFGIGIPAFSTMIQGNSMTIAIRQLSAKIQAARAYAVMNRCCVAILLPNSKTTDLPESMRASAYRVCVVNESGGSYTFDEWIEDESWKTLPYGILRFYSNTDKTVSVVIPAEISVSKAEKNCSIPAIIFKKDGKLVSACSGIYLAHGRNINNEFIFTNADSNGIQTNKISINQYTGKTSTDQNVYYASKKEHMDTTAPVKGE